MYCKNCGKQFEGNFCPNCGTKAYEDPSPTISKDSRQVKGWQPPATLAPIDPDANRKIERHNRKVRICCVFLIIFLIFFSLLSAPKSNTNIYTNSGLSDEKIAALEFFKKDSIEEIISIDSIQGDTVKITGGGWRRIGYTIQFTEDRITKVTNEYNELVYENGIFNPDYRFWENVPDQLLMDYVEGTVTEYLKVPSSAVFPGEEYKPMQGTSYHRDGKYLTLKSSVESQNSLGVQVKNNYEAKLTELTVDSNPLIIYLKIGNDVVIDIR